MTVHWDTILHPPKIELFLAFQLLLLLFLADVLLVKIGELGVVPALAGDHLAFVHPTAVRVSTKFSMVCTWSVTDVGLLGAFGKPGVEVVVTVLIFRLSI